MNIQRRFSKSELQSFEFLVEHFPNLASWLQPPNPIVSKILITKVNGEEVKIYLYSSHYEFAISAFSGNSVNPAGYLGCVRTERFPDDQTAGLKNRTILSDGKYVRQTWDRILQDILGSVLSPIDLRNGPH